MKPHKRTLLASVLAFAFAASGHADAQFANVYFFGDSVSDSGNYMSVLPPGTGKFTTNPGPVWSEVFAQRLGLTATPSTAGGNNYAYGGARITSVPGVVGPPLNPMNVVPIATQVTQYLAKGTANPNALYSIQGGGNDFFYQFALLQAGLATPAQVQAALGAAAVDLAKQAAILKGAGANPNYIMVWSAPDMGTVLGGAASGFGPTLTALSTAFNTTLFGTMDALGVQGIRVNGAALQNEILGNPAAFGIANTTGIACTTPSSVTIALCNASTLVSPNAATTYFWANDSHPTTAGHEILADYALSFIDGPQQIASLAEAPLAVEEANYRALDGRMWSSLDAPGMKKLEFWAAYDYGSSDMNAGPNGGSMTTNTIAVGGDMKLTPRMLIGGMFGYTENRGDFGGAGGGYKLKQPTGTIYAGYGMGPWYLGWTLGGAGLDYSNVNRAIPLGANVRGENGETRGYEYTARMLGGYWFKYRDLLHGPHGRVTYTKAIVDPYAETGSSSTALAYGEQTREQLLWSLGWQVAGRVGNVRPFARVTWEYDSMDDDRSVSASSVTLGGNYSIPAGKPDNSYALFNVGASTDFGGVTGFITGSGTAARDDGNYWAVTVGIRMPL
jgi:outer membrane lipase/esterase